MGSVMRFSSDVRRIRMRISCVTSSRDPEWDDIAIAMLNKGSPFRLPRRKTRSNAPAAERSTRANASVATSKVTSLFRLDSTWYSAKRADCVSVPRTTGSVAQIWIPSRPLGQISRK